MQKQLEQLKDIHKIFGQKWADVPALPDNNTKNLRVTLLKEELSEVVEAMENEPIENVAKELADLLTVVFGTIGAYGLSDKMEEIFDEVHKSNMSKLGEDDKPILREDGKYIKGPNYKLADIKTILQ